MAEKHNNKQQEIQGSYKNRDSSSYSKTMGGNGILNTWLDSLEMTLHRFMVTFFMTSIGKEENKKQKKFEIRMPVYELLRLWMINFLPFV